ncbi:MAG: thiol:disulfide interchange protein DsbA/DsbL [Gammaproteobacteria bacterium]|nr:MAG: thiol:disulfide interchange protein DsbA/DsbL [Gammaproteobacteria bacterium]
MWHRSRKIRVPRQTPRNSGPVHPAFSSIMHSFEKHRGNQMKKILTLSLILLGTTLLWWQPAQAERYVEGVHYHRITPAQPTTHGKKIEVVELFWYGCPHCHHFEPYLAEWLPKLKDDVVFEHMPAIFSTRWELLARAFYAAEILGIQEKIHRPLFIAIHEEKRRITRKEHVVAFFEKFGVSEEAFNKAYNSFAVDSKVRFARKMSRNYQISGTPALIIDGKYRIEPGKNVGFEDMLKIADYLIDKERHNN